tara:strand:+ start:215 stop:460 length:246 start_codon:yes stop_codon:yes gene_type:complete
MFSILYFFLGLLVIPNFRKIPNKLTILYERSQINQITNKSNKTLGTNSRNEIDSHIKFNDCAMIPKDELPKNKGPWEYKEC